MSVPSDYRPFTRSWELGVSAVSVPHLVILLVEKGMMHPDRGRRIVSDMRWVTSAALIDLATRAIDRMHGGVE
ncbi:MAG: hypothetical protein ACOX4G_05760 [Limnochordia bacterium]